MIASFCRLSWRRKLAVLKALLTLQRYSILLRMRPLAKLTAALPMSSAASTSLSDARTEEVLWSVAAASNAVPWLDTCLLRSLAGYDLLVRSGALVELVIGVRKSGLLELDAHAWLEDGAGNRLAEDRADLPSYGELYRVSSGD